MNQPTNAQIYNQTADSPPQLLLTYSRRFAKQHLARGLFDYTLERLAPQEEERLSSLYQHLRDAMRDRPMVPVSTPPRSVSRPSVLSWADSMVLVHAPNQPGELAVRLLKERRASDLQQGLLFELDSYCTFDRD